MERVSSTLKEGRFQGEKGGQGKRISLEGIGESMSGWVPAKILQEDMESLGFAQSLAKPIMKNEVGRQSACSIQDKAK